MKLILLVLILGSFAFAQENNNSAETFVNQNSKHSSLAKIVALNQDKKQTIDSSVRENIKLARATKQTALPVKKTSQKITFKTALALYEKKEYQKAFNAFSVLLETDLASLKYNFYLARSAYFLKKFPIAIAAYERILISKPLNNRAKLELGDIYFILGQYQFSKQYFSEVLESQPPAVVQKKILVFLEKIEGKNSLHSYSGLIQAGLVYDSNINGTSDSDSFYVSSLGLTLTNSSLNVADTAHQEVVVLNHVWDKKDDWGFALKNDVTIFNKSLFEYGDYNILYMSYAPALSWKLGTKSLDVGLSLDTMNYGGEGYLRNSGLFSKMLFNSRKSSSTILLKIIKKSYQLESLKVRDAALSELAYTYQEQLDKRWSYYAKSTLQIERKLSGTSETVDYDSLDINGGAYYIWSSKLRLNSSLGYRYLRYKDDDPFFLTEHVEKRVTLSAGMQNLLSHTLSIKSALTYLYNGSTTETTNYNRITLGVNLVKKF